MSGGSSTVQWVNTIHEAAGVLVRKAKQIGQPVFIRISDLFAQHGTSAELIAKADLILKEEQIQTEYFEEITINLERILIHLEEMDGLNITEEDIS